MKLRALFAGLGLLAMTFEFSRAAAVPTPTSTPTPTPTPVMRSDDDLLGATVIQPTKPPSITPTPTPTSKPKPKEPTRKPTPTPTKKPLEEPKIEGTTINRSVGGGFIGFNFVGNNVVLTFYDSKKKKAPVDVASGVVRWEMKRKIGDDRATFSKGDANTLVSPKAIPPPHNIRFTLLLFKEGSDQAVETYIVTPTG